MSRGTRGQIRFAITAVAAAAAGAATPVLVFCPAARAIDTTWSVDAAGNWSTAANWSAGVPNAIGDTARFLGVITANRLITQDLPNVTVGSIVFNDNNNYTIVPGVATNTITLDGTGGAASITVGSGIQSITGPLVLNDPLTIDVASTFSTSGALSGAGGLEKTGAGTYTMTGGTANTYTGTTTVSGGLLNLNKQIGIVGSLVIGDGTGTDTLRVLSGGNSISDSSAVTINSSGVFDLQTVLETVGTLTMTGGSVTGTTNVLTLGGNVTGNASANTASIGGGTLNLGGAVRTFAVADGSATVDMDVTAAVTNGGIIKSGPGALRLGGTAANTLNNIFQVNEGTLLFGKTAGVNAVNLSLQIGDGIGGADADVVRLEASEQIGPGTAINILSSGLLDLGGQTETVTGLNLSGHVVDGGPTGLLALASTLNTLGGTTTAVIDSTVSLNGASRNFNVADGPPADDLLVNGALVNGALSKLGTGTLKLTGSTANTATLSQVSVGTVVVEKAAGIDAFAGPLMTIGDGAGGFQADVLRYGANDNQLPDTMTVLVQSTGLFDLNGRSDTIGTLRMNGAGVMASGVGVLTVTNEVRADFNPTGTGTINGNLNLAGGLRPFNVADSAPASDLFVSGTMSNGTLQKTGPGTLVLFAPALTSPISYQLDDGGISTTGPLVVGPTRTFTQNGGTFNGSLSNNGTFVYNAGGFSGVLTNGFAGTATFNADFIAGGGLTNDGTINIAAGRTVTGGGGGVINNRTINLQGGTLAAAATTNFNNNDLITGFGELDAPSVNFANLGQIAVSGGDLVIDSNFSPLNLGSITVPAGTRLHLPNSGNMQNQGLITLAGGRITGAAGVTNNLTGQIRANAPGAAVQVSLDNAGVIHATAGATLSISLLTGNTAGGELRVDDGGSLTVVSAFPSSGTVVLAGANATLGGGTITNAGTLRGSGRVNNPVTNNGGTIRAEAGTLTLAAAGNTNPAAGRIQAGPGAQVLYSQGLASNAGQILLTGGTFDNNNVALANPGEIEGHGTVRAGSINNSGEMAFTAGFSDVFGPVTNSNDIVVAGGGTASFYDPLINAAGGNVAVTANSSVVFLDAVTGPGTFSGSGTKYFVDGSSSLPNVATVVGDTVVEASATLTTGRIHEDSLTVHGQTDITGPASPASQVNSLSVTGTLDVGTNHLNVAGTATITGGTLAGTTGVVTAGGGLVVQGAATFSADSAPGTLTLNGPVSGAGSLTKTGPGTATLTGTTSYTGGTNVDAGTLQVKRMHENNAVSIASGAKLTVLDSNPTLPVFPSGDNAFVSRPSSLTIAAGAQLDLGNNDLIIDYTTTSPIGDIEAMIASGFNGGEWNGDGIISTTALNDPNFVLAVAENALLLIPFGDGGAGDDPLFAGQVVDDTTVLVKFTHRVDLDLDGLITGNDAAVFNAFFNEGQPATWQFGDLDYDGVYSGNDAAIFNGFYNESLASVPEPAGLAVAAGGLTLLINRRIRHARRYYATARIRRGCATACRVSSKDY